MWYILNEIFYGGVGIYYATVRRAGADRGEPVRVDAVPGSGSGLQPFYVAIASIGEKEIHLVWDSSSQAGHRHHQWSTDAGITWSSPTPIWGNFFSQAGTNVLLVDRSRQLHVLLQEPST